MDEEEQIVFNVHGFDGARRVNYFGGDPVSQTKVEMRVKKL